MNLRNVYSNIYHQYDELDNYYRRKEAIAALNGWKSTSDWKEKREMNDAIHFLFVFARFEGFLKERSKLFLLQKSSHANYVSGISWLLLKDDADDDRLHFKKHLRLFINSSDADFHTVLDWYKIRNQLAHGGPYNTPINVATAISELLQISRSFII
jgi:hypothetical protein